MSELTRKQAQLLKRQVSKLYGRNYIPLTTTDSNLTIGDILTKKKDISPIIDSSVFNSSSTKFVEGTKSNKNITSSSKVNLSFKFKGDGKFSEYFKINEAGMVVEFTSENQMFLKILGARQQSMKNFVAFRNELLNKYVSGELSPNVYVIRGLVYADKYYLQYSGSKGGTVALNIDAKIQAVKAKASADFSLKWQSEVGYSSHAPNGGVLAYRVSGVRLKRHLMPKRIQANVLNGMSEADALSRIAFSERKKLLNNDAFEVVDLTEEVLLYNNEDLA